MLLHILPLHILPTYIHPPSTETVDTPLSTTTLSSPLRSPLLALDTLSTGTFGLPDLPKALVFVGGADPLRDEGILYTELINEAVAKARGESRVGAGAGGPVAKLHV